MMSELLDESRHVEAALTREYEAQITDLQLRSALDAIIHKVELGALEEQHALELRRREAEVDAARSLVGTSALSAQMAARHGKAMAIKNLEDKARELLNVRTQLHEANKRLQGLSVGSRSLATLQKSNVMQELSTKQGRAAIAGAQSSDGGDNLNTSERHARRLVGHLETVLFASAHGDIKHTHLLLLQLLDRPRVQHLFKMYGSDASRTQEVVQISAKMLEKARETLSGLKTGGTRTMADHGAFEKIICALIPDDAREGYMLGTIQQLLGINLPTVNRAIARFRS